MDLAYTANERVPTPRPVDRIDWLSKACRGARVVDLGAYDGTAIGAKEGRGTWLHAALAQSAASVLGVDSSEMMSAGGVATSATSRIVRGDVCDLRGLLAGEEFDIVVAGELIEHLPDAGAFLRGFRDPLFAGKQLLVTTPNAASLHNTLLGLKRSESTHRDHLALHSLKTLNTLCTRAEFSRWSFVPYHVRFTESISAASGVTRLAARLFERCLNTAEWFFPLLSGGWIVSIEL